MNFICPYLFYIVFEIINLYPGGIFMRNIRKTGPQLLEGVKWKHRSESLH